MNMVSLFNLIKWLLNQTHYSSMGLLPLLSQVSSDQKLEGDTKKVYHLAVDVVHQFCYHVCVDNPATEKSPVHIFVSIRHCYMFIGFIVVEFHVLEANKKSDI